MRNKPSAPSFIHFLLLLALLILCLNSCLLVPVVDSINKTGITRQQRVEQLAPAIQHFQSNLFWGERDRALAFAPSNKQERLRSIIRSFPDDQRIVDAKLVETEFTNEAYKAKVTLKVRSYLPSNLIISERKQYQTWSFELGTGWQIIDLHESKAKT
jgi:hypothetical protein